MIKVSNNFKTQEDFKQRLNAINYKNGQIVKIVYGKDLGNNVEKITTYYGRLGIAYSNMASVILEREQKNALGVETKARKTSDTYIDEYFMLNANGELKLKIFNAFSDNLKAHSDYYYNDKPVSKQWLIDNNLIKDATRKGVCKMFTIMLSDLIYIG